MKGIRVVDMTSVLSGPFCTWLLATLGADVIKVENPNGDLARSTPPFEDDVSLYFASLNRNKRSVKLDLKTDAGREVLHMSLQSQPTVGQAITKLLEQYGVDTVFWHSLRAYAGFLSLPEYQSYPTCPGRQ